MNSGQRTVVDENWSYFLLLKLLPIHTVTIFSFIVYTEQPNGVVDNGVKLTYILTIICSQWDVIFELFFEIIFNG